MIPPPRPSLDTTTEGAIRAFFDAMTREDVDYVDVLSGCVDSNAAEIVPALLRAGWTPPEENR